MKIDLSNRIALITGATRGIGKAVAEQFHLAGASLILTGTNNDEIKFLNTELMRNGISNIKYFTVDFSSIDSTKDFLSEIESMNKLDICVNNAGVNKVAPFLETTEADFSWIHEVNLFAPYKVLKVVGKKMIENRYGKVVNIASIWSVKTRHSRSLYTTAKTGIIGLTRALSEEWAPYNILVNSVSPGFTKTELTTTTNTPEQLRHLSERIPLKRLAEPSEIANLVLFLCSDKNSYLTGQNVIIDGGYTNV